MYILCVYILYFCLYNIIYIIYYIYPAKSLRKNISNIPSQKKRRHVKFSLMIPRRYYNAHGQHWTYKPLGAQGSTKDEPRWAKFAWVWLMCVGDLQPWNYILWNPKMKVWKMIFLFKQVFFFNFPGCITTMLLVFIAGKYQMIIILNEHVLL